MGRYPQKWIQLMNSWPSADAPDVGMENRKSERRRDFRQPVSGKLRILWEDSEGRSQICRADLENVSSKGIRIRVDIRMETGTYVSVNDRNLGVVGRGSVRYCRYEKGRYIVGLEFSGGTGWNPAVAQPCEMKA